MNLCIVWLPLKCLLKSYRPKIKIVILLIKIGNGLIKLRYTLWTCCDRHSFHEPVKSLLFFSRAEQDFSNPHYTGHFNPFVIGQFGSLFVSSNSILKIKTHFASSANHALYNPSSG